MFKDWIPIGLFIITIVGIVGSFFKAKGMDEVQQKNIDCKLSELHSIDDHQWEKIDELKKADAEHEKEDWKMRSELELKIALFQGTVGKLESKLDSLNDNIEEMKNYITARLDKIENEMKKV